MADKTSLLEKLLPNGKGVWIPMDHGVSDYPENGLEDTRSRIIELRDAGVDAIIAQKGLASHYASLLEGQKTSFVIHFSISTRHGGPDSSNKVLVGKADEVIPRGAFGASAQINMGSPNEGIMIERMGSLSRDCFHEGIPLLGMVYARGEYLNPIEGDESMCTAHAARLAFEIGCDVAKVSWKGDENSLIAVRKAVPIPILITPGTGITSDLELLELVQKGMELGANGVCMGRSVFGHKSPKSIATALRLIVHEGKSAEEAILEVGL